MKRAKRTVSILLATAVILCSFCGCSIPTDIDVYALLEMIGLDMTPDQPVDEYVTTYEHYPQVSGYTPISTEDYYSYQKLSDTQKRAYDKMVEYAINFDRSRCFVEGASKKDIDIAFSAVCADYPQFFWIGNAYTYANKDEGCMFSFDNDGGIVCVDSIEERDELNALINQEIEEVLTTVITPDMTDYQKELKLHDYVCSMIEYNDEAASLEGYDYDQMHNWNILGLLKGEGVCAAYTEAFQLLMYNVGIPCTQILGESEDTHVWNALQLEDEWYHIDVTWDDNAVGGLEYTHACFNMTQEHMEKSRDTFLYFTEADDEAFKKGSFNFFDEKANSTKYNYYYAEQLTVVSDTFDSVAAELIKEKWDGESATIELAFSNSFATDKKINKGCSGPKMRELRGKGRKISYAIPAKGYAFVLVMTVDELHSTK